MTGRHLSFKKLGALATLSLLGVAAAPACSGGELDPAETSGETHSEPIRATHNGGFVVTKPALEVIAEHAQSSALLAERFVPTPEIELRRHGERLLPKLQPGSPSPALGLQLSAKASGRLTVHAIENPEQQLALTPLRARDVEGVVHEDGRVVYQQAYSGTDLVVTANHNRLTHTLVLHSEQSPADFRWQVDLAPGLRQVISRRNETSLVDADGHLRLTLGEVALTGADGSVTTTELGLDQDGMATLRLDPTAISYPAVAQFEIVAAPVALAIIPPEIIKARMMVLLDTSGSMAWRFDSNTLAGADQEGGDGDTTSVFCDNNIGTTFNCASNVACTIANGGVNVHGVTPNGSGVITQPSRMLAAKSALSNVVNANSGLIDFGLMRYRESGGCDNTTYCSPPQVGSFLWGRRFNNPNNMDVYRPFNLSMDNVPDGCVVGAPCDGGQTCLANADGNGRAACSCSNDNTQCDGSTVQGVTVGDFDNDCDGSFGGQDFCRIDDLDINLHSTFAGTGCSNFSGFNCTSCGSEGAGRVLVPPSTSSSGQVRRWVDFVEDFCSSTSSAGGPPRNPELRANGYTPLAGSIATARTDWYQPVYNASQALPCADNGNPALCDDLIECRPYVLVVLTDGDDQCGGDPSNEVGALRSVGGGGNPNPVTIYTMGMGNSGGLDTTELNQMAVAGGVSSPAPIAANQEQIEAAFADIVAETVKFEVCNGADDNCNNRIDEGLNVYQECAGNGDCGSSDCDMGRCGCTTDDQCDSGYTCAADSFCRPACAVGRGQCRNDGVRKCGSTGGQCCVDDGSDTCTPLSPLPEGTEICNRLDDDCDGEIDEDFPLGCPQCIPRPEVCNGEDDDCDGLVDNEDPDLVGVGAPCGTNEGICSAGTINCIDGEPVCENEVGEETEVCNGLDDDCNGKTDGQSQACYTGPDGTEDVGVCHGGTQVCVASPGQPGVACSGASCWGACVGEVTPSAEICDGLNNDCDAETDEGVPVTPQTCEDDSECLGTNNCENGVCSCDAGSCSDDYVCGGDNVCYEPDAVTGDQCCGENFSDKCGIGECRFGTWVCAGNRVSCIDSVGPTDEICDGLDNDCDGDVDEDLGGIGEACQADGGACGGALQCVVEYDDNDQPVGGAIVCVAMGEGVPEVCDGVDNDCDNEIDEAPEIFDNDMTGTLTPDGVACNEPPEDQQEGMCKAGRFECIYGQIICVGDVQPGTEQCNGVDDDCDGEVDEGTCLPDGRCIEGVCRFPCGGGEFPCPVGEVCVDRFCVPEAEVTTSGSGGTGTGGTGTGGTGDGSGGSADGGTGGGTGSASGGSGGDGSGGGAGADAGETSAGGTRASTTSFTPPEDDSYKVYGLPTGGGGCSCRVAAPRMPGELSLLLGLVTIGGVLRRRRLRSRGSAA